MGTDLRVCSGEGEVSRTVVDGNECLVHAGKHRAVATMSNGSHTGHGKGCGILSCRGWWDV